MTDAESIIRDIESAFASVALRNGATLHEAAAFEGTDHTSAEERARVRALDPQTRWQDIPDGVLAKSADKFAFDAEGFRYHLPAYMRWHLRHVGEVGPFQGWPLFAHLSVWGHKPKVRAASEQALDVFTGEQKRAIARFVEWMALQARHAEIRDAADQVWQAYWHNFSQSTKGPPAVD